MSKFNPTMATRQESKDAQMLFVGTACALSGCNHHDFLPIRCDLCSETFCFDHFRPVEHKCAKFDPTKADRVAPSCPLCSTPITIPIGQDPNAKMDAHIRNECPSTGNKAPTGKPRCPAPRCNKVLIAPIGCDSCGKSFCPSHRFPKQHSCAARSTNSVSRPSPTPSPQPQPTLTRLTDKLSNVNIASLRPGQSGPAAAAATAAMSREAVSAKPKPTPVMARSTPAEPAGPSSNKPSVPNPFNKTDRRAKAERISQLKGLQARNKKGLLSDAEKSRLAELQAEAKRDGDCVVM